MFEISGNDVLNLDDTELRSLVTRLALAELRSKGCPRSAVTAGGHQDAPDEGLDVRVDCPVEIPSPDFVPRRLTGFQVKKPDMPARAIIKEMRPEGVLRAVIRELADESGAYVIVSAQSSVADKPLRDRRKAIRDALDDLSSASQLHTDLYDRDRLANWVNEYPGIVAWVRSRAGRPLSGWSGINDWEGNTDGAPHPYLFNDKACLIDESSNGRELITIEAGIDRLRSALRTLGQCVRLIGLSGLGKTRLVQALFEEELGTDPLDASLAVYTDYSTTPNPTARDMARDLVASGHRAILIVDNCNPATHSELARLCSGGSSRISLITVEYDVRDDEPEGTDVFRLQSASPSLVVDWLKRSFPNILQSDRERIAEFSDGNFRVARAIAGTLGKGETIGHLKERDLFERIFQQRHQPDKQLLSAAEDLSLLYSIDGDDTSANGELAHVALIRGLEVIHLFQALVEMRQRGVVQARGKFRAILPQAISNPLAANALERIPPTDFDRFCAALPPRMLKSVSRRLGFLHTSVVARATVERWLRADGPLGELMAKGAEGLQIITNIAPVAPEAVLAMLEAELKGPNGHSISAPHAPNRYQWIRLIKALGYEAHLFERAMRILARFLASEPEGNTRNSVSEPFGEFFHLHLSGTKATPGQRRAEIRRLADSNDPALRRCASVALKALLESSHFTSMGETDFGACSRGWGWEPKINRDIWDWFNEAITLAVELAPQLTDARRILAQKICSLYQIEACHEALEHAATVLTQERPWLEGWTGFVDALRFGRNNMPEHTRANLKKMINRLKPSSLLHKARLTIIEQVRGGWDFDKEEGDDHEELPSWEKADKVAEAVGRSLASDAGVRDQFLAELLASPHPQRAVQCGQGLAKGTDNPGLMWRELVTAYEAAAPSIRSGKVLGGFLSGMHQLNPGFTPPVLDAIIDNPDLAAILPYLQACIGLDDEGISRLRRAISKGVFAAHNFYSLAGGAVSKSPPHPLGALLEDISNLSGGVEIALEILHMHFWRKPEPGTERHERLISVGRDLLTRVSYGKEWKQFDYGANAVILICLVGADAEITARQMCVNIRSALESVYFSWRDLSHTLEALFKTQPLAALDEFLLPNPSQGRQFLFEAALIRNTPFDNLEPDTLKQWAGLDPGARYSLIGKYLSMFKKENGEDGNEFSPLFLSLLEDAPNKRQFLGGLRSRLHPGSWFGSLAEVLIQRKAQVMRLAEHPDKEVKDWVADVISELAPWIEQERQRDRRTEESFE